MHPSRRARPYRAIHMQRGAVIFVALIALVTLMIAAVALTRSVDTATVAANNLALRQATVSSGDGGLEAAADWMREIERNNAGNDPFTNVDHPFNKTSAVNGYFSYVRQGEAYLTAPATWADGVSRDVGTDPSGNRVRYIIERLCRTENQLLSETDCLFGDAVKEGESLQAGEPQPFKSGKNPLNRVTVQITGPKNTVSYVQAFIY